MVVSVLGRTGVDALSAEMLRDQQQTIRPEGVLDSDDLKVTAQATPASSVLVAAGKAVIEDDSEESGSYLLQNSASATLTIATANTVNPRTDIVVANGSAGTIVVVTGNPSATPVTPATPTHSYKLATINVPAVASGPTQITSAMIVDNRTRSENTKTQVLVNADAAVGFLDAAFTIFEATITLPTGWYQMAVEVYGYCEFNNESTTQQKRILTTMEMPTGTVTPNLAGITVPLAHAAGVGSLALATIAAQGSAFTASTTFRYRAQTTHGSGSSAVRRYCWAKLTRQR